MPDQVPFTSYTPNIAIITGGAQGMGYAISHRLADDGFDVAINDIPAKNAQIDTVVEELHKKGRRAIAVPGDVSSEEDVIFIIQKTVQELGGVDLIVANAGIPSSDRLLLETTLENFEKIHAVNARGVFLCFKYAGQQMVKQGRGGRLIAASSVFGKSGGARMTDYTSSKFTVRAIAQCAGGLPILRLHSLIPIGIAAELREHGITANTYAPGPVNTPMLANTPESLKVDPKTVAGPECIASIVSYIAKPESYFLNGEMRPDGRFFVQERLITLYNQDKASPSMADIIDLTDVASPGC